MRKLGKLTLPLNFHRTMKPHQELTPEQLEKIRGHAEAVRRMALENMQLHLHYDKEGVRWVAGYIDRMRNQVDQRSRQGAILFLGAFFGECMIRNIGGTWGLSDNKVCVYFEDGFTVFPGTKVAKQYENGSEGGDSVLGMYEVVLAMRAASKPPSPAQKRLLEFQKNAANCIYVPNGANAKIQWLAVRGIQDGWVALQHDLVTHAKMSVPLNSIDSFYVCAPDGKLIHQEWIAKSYYPTLPEQILTQIQGSLPADTFLTLDQTESGKKFIVIEYSKSNTKKAGYTYFASSLRNISDEKIKIVKFGGFRFNGAAWALQSVTGSFYTADNFRDWYQQKGVWLLPGETVCDMANWGSPPSLWAYYGVTESGESFVAGKCIEKAFEDADNKQSSSDSSLTTDRNHPGLNDHPNGGKNSAYLILSEEERAKGFVRPVRRSYVHTCGRTTTMALALCETIARDPKFYGRAFCFACDKHFPIHEFKWTEDGMQVGT